MMTIVTPTGEMTLDMTSEAGISRGIINNGQMTNKYELIINIWPLILLTLDTGMGSLSRPGDWILIIIISIKYIWQTRRLPNNYNTPRLWSLRSK